VTTNSNSYLTRKFLLTNIENMVVSPDRDQDVFEAISHPARRRILDLLSEADRSVNTIAGHFQMSRPAVSQHLHILVDADLATKHRHAESAAIALSPRGSGRCGTGSRTTSGSGKTTSSCFIGI
jgi:DNA-binding MarR family transcriptional regulator